MISVITIFHHPDLGSVRGTVIDGVPMLCCRELARLLGGTNIEETERAMRRFYLTRDVTVPVSVHDSGIAETEKLLFIDAVAVLRLIECSANRAWEKYACWFMDFVFPALRQLASTAEVSEDAHRFYWECADPKSPRPVNHNLDTLFDRMK